MPRSNHSLRIFDYPLFSQVSGLPNPSAELRAEYTLLSEDIGHYDKSDDLSLSRLHRC